MFHLYENSMCLVFYTRYCSLEDCTRGFKTDYNSIAGTAVKSIPLGQRTTLVATLTDDGAAIHLKIRPQFITSAIVRTSPATFITARMTIQDCLINTKHRKQRTHRLWTYRWHAEDTHYARRGSRHPLITLYLAHSVHINLHQTTTTDGTQFS